MSLSMYQASIPLLTRGLANLSAILDKAAAYADDRKIDSAILVGARLAPTMFALARQVQIASDTAKGCAARLAGIAVPNYADTEATIPELQARIAKTIGFLQSVSAAQIDGSEGRPVTFKLGGNDVGFTGQNYLLTFVLPNFYFHITTAYDILRHNGVPLGKPDYIGAF